MLLAAVSVENRCTLRQQWLHNSSALSHTCSLPSGQEEGQACRHAGRQAGRQAATGRKGQCGDALKGPGARVVAADRPIILKHP